MSIGWLIAVACSRPATPTAAPSSEAAPSSVTASASAAQATSAAPAVASPGGDLTFTGMCDASGAIPLDSNVFVVADDEDNSLRAYDVRRPGPPLWSVDVSAAIGVDAKPSKPGKAPKAPPEVDVEAATRIGELAFWLTSHGRNSSGKLKPERLRLFATNIPSSSEPLKVRGAYADLLQDLLAEPRLAPFGLAAAAELAPKSPGGFNLEGLTRRREGGAWIGFRNPIPQGKALLIPLLNPEQLLEGASAKLGDPVLLDLGGRGVRSLSLHGDRYLVAAGAFDGSPGSQLFIWDGGQGVRPSAADVTGLNPEGFFSPPGENRVLLLSDDGSLLIDGTECKRVKDASQKRFRARFVVP